MNIRLLVSGLVTEQTIVALHGLSVYKEFEFSGMGIALEAGCIVMYSTVTAVSIKEEHRKHVAVN